MLHARAANIRCDRYCSTFWDFGVELNTRLGTGCWRGGCGRANEDVKQNESNRYFNRWQWWVIFLKVDLVEHLLSWQIHQIGGTDLLVELDVFNKLF